MDEELQHALRTDLDLYLGTRGRGQWFTAEQLYDALGVGRRPGTVTREEFHLLLRQLAERKAIGHWRAAGGSSEMFGLR